MMPPPLRAPAPPPLPTQQAPLKRRVPALLVGLPFLLVAGVAGFRLGAPPTTAPPSGTAAAPYVPLPSQPGVQTPPEVREQPDKREPAPPTLGGTWQDYVNEYDENELAADKKLKGVRVQVTGRVKSIGMGVGGEPFLTLGEPFNGVHCTFGKADEQQLAALRKGEPVIVDCTVRTRVLGLVAMNECVLRTTAAPLQR